MNVSNAKALIILLSGFALAGCAHVKQNFSAYEGKNSIQEGEGGTKEVFDGVEIWTSGAPPKKFKVLGVLTDQRRDQRFAAAGFGQSVAKKIREHGGDAAIVLDSESKFLGTYSSGSATAYSHGNSASAYGSGYGVAISDKITSLMVVKYIE